MPPERSGFECVDSSHCDSQSMRFSGEPTRNNQVFLPSTAADVGLALIIFSLSLVGDACQTMLNTDVPIPGHRLAI